MIILTANVRSGQFYELYSTLTILRIVRVVSYLCYRFRCGKQHIIPFNILHRTGNGWNVYVYLRTECHMVALIVRMEYRVLDEGWSINSVY